MSASHSYPVAVIGAGPVGLAAAAHLSAAGQPFIVLEAGDSVAASVRSWGHVRVFSPWRYNMDEVAVSMLAELGWSAPAQDGFPTGNEFVDLYLAPLAEHPSIAPALRLGSTVESIARLGLDKLKSEGREAAPFEVTFRTNGAQQRILARAVIDASGTYRSPNPLGSGGVPARGEPEAARRIYYGIPDVLGGHRARYAGKRVLVVGSGHSAFNALQDLSKLAPSGTSITWAIRGRAPDGQYGGGATDQLPRRGELGTVIRELVNRGVVNLETGFHADHVAETAAGLVVSAGDRSLPVADEVIVATGFRPDLAMTRELRLQLDDVVESPRALAPLIDPNLHSCGTVPPHGAAQLRHPEPDFYTVGMKSYGRAPTFLMLTGYEQVRSVVAALSGDLAGSLDVRLVLPETGVCNGAAAAQGEGCCGGPAPAGSDACCVLDAEAKADGEPGCGCGTQSSEPQLITIA